MKALAQTYLLAGIVSLSLTGCGSDEKRTVTDFSEPETDLSAELEAEPYSDLKMFELRGPVKGCVKETFYDVDMGPDSLIVNDDEQVRRRTELYFDRTGNYVVSNSEKIERDAKGQITYWRDNRPNNPKTHPGMLRDTLRYTHVNNNVLQSSGMGEFAVTVYDNEGRIVGQYSEPDIDGTQMAAFNVYRIFDSYGNWTERLTVWTSQSAHGKPHVSYTLDRRDISYY
ncbi:MAG: hypothetical protein HDS11_08105 [Bacteroides sp.]|nr:hypothetical protein [Bacteroides sp.]